MTGLPAPEQWVLEEMNEMEVAEMIEEHIDYVDKNGRSVHLPMPFVRHFMVRHDGVLPTVVTIATLPIVLADGGLLAGDTPDGLDRDRGIIFKIQPEVRAVVPRREDCTPTAVREAMEFLTNEWLVDVACDYEGKCILVALALTLIERSMLDNRPAFFVTAGKRGGGKTTTLIMLIMAVTGIWPAAAAWSTNEEERRKALLSYFLYGVPYILWDNIKRGTQISCPHIERSCTAAFYSDRKLGVSEMVATAASTINLFTGNNIAPKGDLSSRSLQIRLAVNQADPENRKFVHPDPIDWTEGHRAEILGALYTILLGNEQLRLPHDAPAPTRFKTWWRLVGSAVENAAALVGEEVDFARLFLTQEDDEEEGTALAEVLTIMRRRWPGWFKGGDVADLINDRNSVTFGTGTYADNKADAAALRDFLFGPTAAGFTTTAISVGIQLRKFVDGPVQVDDKTFVLRRKTVQKAAQFMVSEIVPDNPWEKK